MLGQHTTEASLPRAASTQKHSSQKWVRTSAKSWFIVAAMGQGIFTLYILGLYGVATLTGNWEAYNAVMPHGYQPGDAPHNVSIVMHVLLAAIVSFGGPMQIIPVVRNRFPKFHRINGRVYILSGVIISLTGIFILWTKGSVGGLIGAIATSLNGLLILAFAIPTIKFAWTKQFERHRRWSLRFFMVMSGVWFFRVGINFWLILWGRPVGFDPQTFTGPFLVALGFGQYLLPLLILELYFWAKKQSSTLTQYTFGSVLMLCTIITTVGVIGATLFMWFPRL